MQQVAAWVGRALRAMEDEAALAGIREEVKALCLQFPLYAHRLK